jgi:hypothetical protein
MDALMLVLVGGAFLAALAVLSRRRPSHDRRDATAGDGSSAAVSDSGPSCDASDSNSSDCSTDGGGDGGGGGGD